MTSKKDKKLVTNKWVCAILNAEKWRWQLRCSVCSALEWTAVKRMKAGENANQMRSRIRYDRLINIWHCLPIDFDSNEHSQNGSHATTEGPNGNVLGDDSKSLSCPPLSHFHYKWPSANCIWKNALHIRCQDSFLFLFKSSSFYDNCFLLLFFPLSTGGSINIERDTVRLCRDGAIFGNH